MSRPAGRYAKGKNTIARWRVPSASERPALFVGAQIQIAGRRDVPVSRCIAVHGILITMAACTTQSALALDPRYPDWPCQQLKVPGIAVASVWNGPQIATGDEAKPVDAKLSELVSRLAARRTPME